MRLRPRAGGDVFDLALAGETAVVEARRARTWRATCRRRRSSTTTRAATSASAPAGHRFFFSPEEVEPLGDDDAAPVGPRVLVAGIGNVFLGDDGFGVALAGRLAPRELPAGVDVVDFGIRGMDLAYALQADYDVVVLARRRRRAASAPGTLYVIEPDLDGAAAATSTPTGWTR